MYPIRHHWPEVFLAIFFAFSGTAGAAGEPPLLAFVSVPPQAAFVRAVGGAHVRVEVMVPAGRNHENYEPAPRQLAALSRARLYFRIGLPFEDSWLGKILDNNPHLTLVDTRRDVPMLSMSATGEERPATHGAPDPHIWLDPNRVKIQALTVRNALAAADPAHQADYDRNLAEFTARLTRLDQDIRRILSRSPSKRFMVYHPSWGYFAQAYGLEQIPIEIEGKEPGPRSLARMIATARRLGVKTIFVSQQISPRSAQVIAQAIGGTVAAVADVPEDYFGALQTMARLIAGQPS
jgi:zinc transport system substrate-binding protein